MRSTYLYGCAPAVVLLAAGAAIGQAIATGANGAIDGYLRVVPDAYGSWASTGFGGGGDLFNPTGAAVGAEVAFTSGFLFFSGNQRELLSNSNDWQNTFPADASLSRSVTSPSVASDTNGDLINDTLQSAFSVTGGAVNLGFSLRQHVATSGPGVSFLRQDYTITNNATLPLSFNMVRSFDGDLVWDGDFANDNVGTTMHGAGLGTYVYQNEPGFADRAVTLSAAMANVYYGGKNGVTPGGGAPAYGFGTDTQVWDAFGVPTTWDNHIAGVGYGTNGDSGPPPAGSGATPDGFIGLGFDLNLNPGESVTLSVVHTYGATTPIPAPAGLVLVAFGTAAAARRRR